MAYEQSLKKPIFVDTSALIALHVKDDEFHQEAIDFWKEASSYPLKFVTSNFILDEVYTWIRSKRGKRTAVDFAEYLAENTDILRVVRVFLKDEKEAFKYFRKLPDRDLSFTDCTSFALMKRLGLREAFSFDKHFKKAGFILRP